MIYAVDGLTPQIHPSVWIAPTAAIIGDVILEEGVTIWFGCTLRGDAGQIRVGAGTNIQDGSVLHEACTIGEDCSIAHMVLVHRAKVGNRVLIGNGALVYDDVEIGDDAIIGAGALVTPGTRVAPDTLMLGVPARPLRKVDEGLRRMSQETVQAYHQHRVQYLERFRQIE